MGPVSTLTNAMRKSDQNFSDVIKAEEAAENRKQSRARGFTLMKERDSGLGVIHEKSGKVKNIDFYWNLDPEDHTFKLSVHPYGKETMDLYLDAEEFRKCLRWV